LRIPIHREGWPFIALFIVLNILVYLAWAPAGWAFLLLTLWCVAFFRDPERKTPEGAGLLTSPADGKLLPIVNAVPPLELGMGETPRPRLSIFMNVFNVHVNRMPADGRVVALGYRKGRFFNASFDKASIHNERMSVRLQLSTAAANGAAAGKELAVVQIAGLVARRIKCDLKPDQIVGRGERFGIIRFGSRVDVYLPPGTEIVAKPGQHVTAGTTVLAKLS
jgi:phosphatidylserine decarboxylase